MPADLPVDLETFLFRQLPSDLSLDEEAASLIKQLMREGATLLARGTGTRFANDSGSQEMAITNTKKLGAALKAQQHSAMLGARDVKAVLAKICPLFPFCAE